MESKQEKEFKAGSMKETVAEELCMNSCKLQPQHQKEHSSGSNIESLVPAMGGNPSPSRLERHKKNAVAVFRP